MDDKIANPPELDALFNGSTSVIKQEFLVPKRGAENCHYHFTSEEKNRAVVVGDLTDSDDMILGLYWTTDEGQKLRAEFAIRPEMAEAMFSLLFLQMEKRLRDGKEFSILNPEAMRDMFY